MQFNITIKEIDRIRMTWQLKKTKICPQLSWSSPTAAALSERAGVITPLGLFRLTNTTTFLFTYLPAQHSTSQDISSSDDCVAVSLNSLRQFS